MKMKVTFENYYGIKTIRLASIKTEKPHEVCFLYHVHPVDLISLVLAFQNML